jgi:hypothetical protein
VENLLYRRGLYAEVISFSKLKINQSNFIYIISSLLALNKNKEAQNIFNQYKSTFALKRNDLFKILRFSDLFIFKNIQYFKIPPIIRLLLHSNFSFFKKNDIQHFLFLRFLELMKKVDNFVFRSFDFMIFSLF